ncbi:cupin domain-containing protein [Maribellus sp. CM-23]|uniref:cupin domain-containing protein n=1 Tax=Maribellus sp. CM-23 TaxID=2781026 RepID=UPI0021D4304D|nr:cupin domain-containing protein [Maribellus sp. CM-23]MCE4566872.1 cupin domain-containing protein [Maribellus sp. CM-23]
MHYSPQYWIEKLGLARHPEGGWFKEVYRSEEQMLPDPACFQQRGERNVCTSIYYLLEGDDFSAFHRIKSDEIWHYYTGTSAIEVLWIDNGNLRQFVLGVGGKDAFQAVVPKNTWFAARLADRSGFALVGCTVAPGFQFDDFEMADEKLLDEFPGLATDIAALVKH